MLSYRHAFHAGNHADVLKHLTQVLILDYLRKKGDKPLRYIDTHSGAGSYDLCQGFAAQNEEFTSGITLLWQQTNLPEPIARYLKLIKSFNSSDNLTRYPGSPAIARAMLGEKQKLQLFELHQSDYEQLHHWARGDRRITVEQLDGFARLPKSLPPQERRALVLIDPPYELKQDYSTVLSTLEKSMQLFATGTYLLWYPLLQRDEVGRLLTKLRQKPWRWLNAELKVYDQGGGGMYGSGVFVINPPWHLREELTLCLPMLKQLLGKAGESSFELMTHGLD